jgi:hypothetical protein
VKAHAAVAGVEPTVDTRSAETSGAHPADVAAAKSTAARESTTDVAAPEPAAAEAATMTAAEAAAATTVTAAATTTTSSEGVSPDRRHTEGDHRKHDTNFAQHGILHHGRDGVRFFCRYRHTAQCEFGPDYKGM